MDTTYYTNEPIFCKSSGEQLMIGIEVMGGPVPGIYSFKEFASHAHFIFGEEKALYIRRIESCCFPDLKTKNGKRNNRERNKLTLKLRYQILKRDNFKCKSCGKNASEVKLEIDHIIPISKGGKTIESNLQTLCVYCNGGKSNG